VTVTTKLGIVPPRRSRAFDAAKRAARAAARVAPVLRPLLRRGAQSMGQSGAFEPDAARASLETSLRELGVDAVDILLLHELRPADAQPGLLAFLEAARGEGKLRSFGLATDRDSTATVLRERPELAQVVQVAHTAVDPPLERLGAPAGVPILTHSAVAALLGRLTEAMADAGRRRRWSDELGVDCGSREQLARLLLAGALRANPGGVVLFSSTDERRIRANAELAGAGAPEAALLERFDRLVREL
jgi:aryl-alcohol dehydrogenase-like predicted oxidoreductase